jgi:DNA-binding transcriptional regulator LsrR (DeoR family)
MSARSDAVTSSGGPAHLVLTAAVARRYYLDGRSKVEIADEFVLSRFKVARLLEDARSSGLVRIEIGDPGGIDLELSRRVKQAYGLTHAVVVDVHEEDSATLRHRVGEAAAELLREITTPIDVLGLAWARSVSVMTGALTRLPTIPIVQLTGALQLAEPPSGPGAFDSSIEIVRDAAAISGGPAYLFYAPFILRDANLALAMRRQPEVARALEMVASVTKAVVGIGLCEPGQSTVYDAIGPREQRTLRRLGVRAEVSGVLIDGEGRPVRAELTSRMIGVSAHQLRQVPEVLAIAYGVLKAPAVNAALRGGLVRSLVTHRTLAEALLDHVDAVASGPEPDREAAN